MQEFPVYNTKIAGDTRRFSLEDPQQRKLYFEHKAKDEISLIRDYLANKSFVAFLMGKKNSGKGTYSKLFMEAVGRENIAHIAVGDIVRAANVALLDPAKKEDIVKFLRSRYRGPLTVERIVDVITGRDTITLLPTEVILALVSREIDAIGRKSIFVDGFPRTIDQVSLSLYFKDLVGYRGHPDFFVFLHVPNTVIDERIKNRVICPKCNTPRSLKLLRTKEAGYDATTKSFYLKCENPDCHGARMYPKEGDELGIEPIRARVEMDDKISEILQSMSGTEKILLRNSVPVASKASVDEYEITPSYTYRLDESTGQVIIGEEPWTIPDDVGVLSYSLLPAAVVLSFIKQTAQLLRKIT